MFNTPSNLKTPALILAFAIGGSACGTNTPRTDEIGQDPNRVTLSSHGGTRFDRALARSSEVIFWVFDDAPEKQHPINYDECYVVKGDIIDKSNGAIVLTGTVGALVLGKVTLCSLFTGVGAPFCGAVFAGAGLGLTSKTMDHLTCPAPPEITTEQKSMDLNLR